MIDFIIALILTNKIYLNVAAMMPLIQVSFSPQVATILILFSFLCEQSQKWICEHVQYFFFTRFQATLTGFFTL